MLSIAMAPLLREYRKDKAQVYMFHCQTDTYMGNCWLLVAMGNHCLHTKQEGHKHHTNCFKRAK